MNQHATTSSEHPLHIRVAGCSEMGRLLKQNEDAFALYEVSEPDQAERLGKLYVLADGMGQHDTGGTASRLAIETIPEVYYHQSKGDSPLGRLQQAFLAAHQRIREFAALHPVHAGIATTCTAVVVRERRLWIGHIGDSRAYLVHLSDRSRPTIERLTTDHSQVAAWVRAGELAPELMRRSPYHRDIQLRALGQSEENLPLPDFILRDIRPDDALVLCSDGLWGALSEEQIVHTMSNRPIQQACYELVQQANAVAGDEDISVVILSFS